MYVYKFINNKDEVIYIGRTKSIKKRINNHRHLPIECYKNTAKIKYAKLNNKDEAAIYERYLINMISPLYNDQFNNKSNFNFELPILKWENYENFSGLICLEEIN